MAIISILAALTVPMLANVQEKAKAAGCLSNQRNIGGAIRAYGSDHNDLLIPIENDNRGGEGWAYRLVSLDYITAPIDPTHNDIKFRNTPFRCPSGIDEVTSVGATITSRDDPDGGKATAYSDETANEYIHCWYGINGSTWGSEFWPFVQNPLDDGRTVKNQMSMVGSPSRIPMIYDGWWIHNGKDERIHARHNGGTTTSLLFFDGHVETLTTYLLPGVREQAQGAITWRIQ